VAWNNLAVDARKLYNELHRAADGYSLNIPALERLLAEGWSADRDYETRTANTLRYLDEANTQSNVQSFQRDLARLSSRLSEFDLLPGMTHQQAVHASRENERSSTRPAVPPQTFMPPSGGGGVQTQAEGVS
jgi:hypothetical protein